MKKIALFLYSLLLTSNASSSEHVKNQKLVDILKNSKVPVNTESSADGSRSTEGGNGNGGRPKIQK